MTPEFANLGEGAAKDNDGNMFRYRFVEFAVEEIPLTGLPNSRTYKRRQRPQVKCNQSCEAWRCKYHETVGGNVNECMVADGQYKYPYGPDGGRLLGLCMKNQ